MNLNSYIGLMGGSYQEVATPPGAAARAGRRRPRPTLDRPRPRLRADPRRRQRAAARVLPAPGAPHGAARARRASRVAQTPYSAFPGSATRIERIAGATTDLQHIVHQGMTHYDATFWVGANAVLRKRALDDIVEVEYEGDCEIRRYIQDRTVIEDTESTHRPRRPRLDAATTTRSGSPTAPRRPTSARCASSASAGRTAAC